MHTRRLPMLQHGPASFHMHTYFDKSPPQVAAFTVSRRRGEVTSQWIDSEEAEECAATRESGRHHANSATADAKTDAAKRVALVAARLAYAGGFGATLDPAATAAASHLERAEAATEAVYGHVTSNFAAALVLAARGCGDW